ncbi:MAG: hypothetical protein GWN17_04335 [Candidatus Korarchaeota archaeon]|nr:hypothetical protein [Candidatus Korarchaeota archaeon]
MKRLGVGFLGTGWIVNTYHVKAWRGVRHADITAICDLTEERAKTSAALFRELGACMQKKRQDFSLM